MSVRKLLCLLLALTALGFHGPGIAETEKPLARDLIDAPAYAAGVLVPGRGVMRYYAQNDPAWAMMKYRFPHQQVEPRFSGAGCVPSALANLLVNLMPPQRLPLVESHSYLGKGFWICPCSMNRLNCNQTHQRFRLTTVQEYQSYFCLAIGSYLSGNNDLDEYACGSMYLNESLYRIYDLKYKLVGTDLREAEREVNRAGALAIMMVGGSDCPFTTSGHALVLCASDSEYYYFLDSFRREEYELDYQHILRVVEPGVVGVRRKNANNLGAYQIHVVYPYESQSASQNP